MRPQFHCGKGEQAGARPDIDVVARHHAFALHQVEHREATRGGLVLPGPEGLTGGDYEIDQFGVGLVVGRADVEPSRADRVDAFLAFGHPVGLGQFLDGEFRRPVLEQRGDPRHFLFTGSVIEIDLEGPFVGQVVGHLHPGDHPVRRPVERVFMRDERGLGDGLRNLGIDLPGVSHPLPPPAARRAALRPHRHSPRSSCPRPSIPQRRVSPCRWPRGAG